MPELCGDGRRDQGAVRVMLTLAALARSLRTIQAELAELSANADRAHPLDPHDVKIAGIKVGCQAELIEKGLLEC